MEFLTEFPTMGRTDLRDLKKAIDAGFREFSRSYGEGLEDFFHPLLKFMVWFEKLLVNTPWPIVLLVISALVWLGSRSWKMVTGTLACFLVIGYLDMWEDTMATLAIDAHDHIQGLGADIDTRGEHQLPPEVAIGLTLSVPRPCTPVLSAL